MAMMFGYDQSLEPVSGKTIKKTAKSSQFIFEGTTPKSVTINGVDYAVAGLTIKYYGEDGAEVSSPTSASDFVYAVLDMLANNKVTIEISGDKFPGTYKVIGDTYARSEKTGEDEFFQLVFEKAKIKSEVTLTMEAEGDPSTFSMNLEVLRPEDGKMIKLIKYDLDADQKAFSISPFEGTVSQLAAAAGVAVDFANVAGTKVTYSAPTGYTVTVDGITGATIKNASATAGDTITFTDKGSGQTATFTVKAS